MQYVTETLDPRTGEPMTTERGPQEMQESQRGSISSFISNHPWVCLAAAFGAGLAVGVERQRIMTGARWVGTGARTVGNGAWTRVGNVMGRVRR